MRGIGYVTLLVVMFSMCSGCPSVGTNNKSSTGSASLGTAYKGSTGWKSLSPVSPVHIGKSLVQTSLFETRDFGTRYDVSSNFTIRICPENQNLTESQVQLSVSFHQMHEFTPKKGVGVYITYPSKFWNKTYLRGDTGKAIGYANKVTKKTVGGKSVFTLTCTNCPRGKWLMTDKTSGQTYFINIQ